MRHPVFYRELRAGSSVLGAFKGTVERRWVRSGGGAAVPPSASRTRSPRKPGSAPAERPLRAPPSSPGLHRSTFCFCGFDFPGACGSGSCSTPSSGCFGSASHAPGLSTSWQVSGSFSFLRLSNASRCGWTTFCCPLMGGLLPPLAAVNTAVHTLCSSPSDKYWRWNGWVTR